MHNDPQWAGNSQKEMADSFQYVVENFPQIPVGKITRSLFVRIRRLVLAIRDLVKKSDEQASIYNDQERVTE